MRIAVKPGRLRGLSRSGFIRFKELVVKLLKMPQSNNNFEINQNCDEMFIIRDITYLFFSRDVESNYWALCS